LLVACEAGHSKPGLAVVQEADSDDDTTAQFTHDQGVTIMPGVGAILSVHESETSLLLAQWRYSWCAVTQEYPEGRTEPGEAPPDAESTAVNWTRAQGTTSPGAGPHLIHYSLQQQADGQWVMMICKHGYTVALGYWE